MKKSRKDGRGRKKKDNNYDKTEFPNGLTLITEQVEGFESVSLGIWIKTGSRNEESNEAGISHFLEHMLFKGTKERTTLEIAQQLDQLGGHYNAFTDRELTCYHLYLLSQDIEIGVEILCDMILNSKFDKKEINQEKKVIIQELSMVEDDPEEFSYDLFYELVFSNYGLGTSILGTKETIKNMNQKQILKYYNKYYCPKNLIISAVGCLDHNKLKKQISDIFDFDSKKNNILPPRSIKSNPIKCSPDNKIWWVERDTEQVQLIWGVQGPKYSENCFASFLLNLYLGVGMSSSLFQEIREKEGLVYTVYSDITQFTDSGIFSIYAATSTKDVLRCLELIEKCVKMIQTNLIDEKDLSFLKDKLKRSMMLSSEDLESRMERLAKNYIFLGKKYITMKEQCEKIDRISSEDIRKVANQIINNKRSILAVGPKPMSSMNDKIIII